MEKAKLWSQMVLNAVFGLLLGLVAIGLLLIVILGQWGWVLTIFGLLVVLLIGWFALWFLKNSSKHATELKKLKMSQMLRKFEQTARGD